MNYIERASQLLFPENGSQAYNVKFFCAGDENVSAEGLAEQLVRAEVQVRNGSARLVESVDRHLTSAE